MFRRILSLILTLFATIILLAHTAIPHHHHINQVCLVAEHCQNESDSHEHENGSPLHEHDGTNDYENCILKQLVAITSYHARPNIKLWDIELDHTVFIGIIAYLVDNDSDTNNAHTNSTSILPFSSSIYSYIISYSLGLRAPPVV
jgi:cell division protein FtsL